MSQVYTTFERPQSAKAAVAIAEGVFVFPSAATTDGGVTMGLPLAAGGIVAGVAVSKAASGEAVSYTSEVGRIVPVKASAAFAVKAELSTTAAGLAKTAVTGEKIVAIALQAATAANQVVSALLLPSGTKA